MDDCVCLLSPAIINKVAYWDNNSNPAKDGPNTSCLNREVSQCLHQPLRSPPFVFLSSHLQALPVQNCFRAPIPPQVRISQCASLTHPATILRFPYTSPLTSRPGPTLNLKTPYYSASIPIWHDTLEFTTRSIQTWEAEWKTPEAAEVVRSIGAWAICFPKPASKEQYV